MKILTYLAILVTLAVLPFGCMMYFRSLPSETQGIKIDWNPSIRSDEEILGEWSGKDEHIYLLADKTFSYNIQSTTITGTWTRNDWNLYLSGKDYSAGMRFVTLSKQFLLIKELPDFTTDEGGVQAAAAISSGLKKTKQ